MHRPALILILIIFNFTSFGQTIPSYNSLLDTATKGSGLFISAYPVKSIRLNLSDTSNYRDYLKSEYNYEIDETVLIELIENCKNPDTTKWTDEDFTKFVFVETSETYINAKDIIKKFNLTDKLQIKKLKRQVADFNYTNPLTKDIYYFSRPVFDNTKTYAVISHGNGNKGLMGRDYISLFHYESSSWKEIGVIARWIY